MNPQRRATPERPRVRVYCASPAPRAKMWRDELIPSIYGGSIAVVSTWHAFDIDESDLRHDHAAHWEQDFREIRQADTLLVYAEHKDRPNGTLVEIGYAIANEMPVYLVGNFEWGTWKHHPLVTHCATFVEAVAIITKEHTNVQT